LYLLPVDGRTEISCHEADIGKNEWSWKTGWAHFKPGISEGSLMQLINEQTEPEKSGGREGLKLDVLLVHGDLPATWRAEQVLDQAAFNVEPKGNIPGGCT
jgi:hypothetical protein